MPQSPSCRTRVIEDIHVQTDMKTNEGNRCEQRLCSTNLPRENRLPVLKNGIRNSYFCIVLLENVQEILLQWLVKTENPQAIMEKIVPTHNRNRKNGLNRRKS